MNFDEFLLLLNRISLNNNLQLIRIITCLLNGPYSLKECNCNESGENEMKMDTFKHKKQLLTNESIQIIRDSVKYEKILSNVSLVFNGFEGNGELFFSKDKFIFENILLKN